MPFTGATFIKMALFTRFLLPSDEIFFWKRDLIILKELVL